MGLLLLLTGVLFLVYGWRLPRFLLALSIAMVFAGGGIVLEMDDIPVAGLLIGGLALGGVLAVWANTLAVALLVGVWGAALIGGLFLHIEAAESVVIIAGAVAFITGVALALTAITKSMAFVTSVEGSILMVAGGLILLAATSSWYAFLQDAVAHNPVFLPFLLLVGIATGYYFQLAAISEKKAGLSGN